MASLENLDDLFDLDNMDYDQDPMMGRQYMDQEMDDLPDLEMNMQETEDWPFNP